MGHFALQFASVLGAKEVVAITTSADKGDAARGFGATDILVSKDPKEMKRRSGTLDFILVTVSAEIPWQQYFRLLKPSGHLCLVGLPPSGEVKLNAFQITGRNLQFSGSNTASIAEIKEMIQVAAAGGVRCAAELLPLSSAGVNEAVKRVQANTPRFRCVLVREDGKF